MCNVHYGYYHVTVYLLGLVQSIILVGKIERQDEDGNVVSEAAIQNDTVMVVPISMIMVEDNI